MSLNNLNKRNLFEMKNQNRYAQLVEAQSPEPPEVEPESAASVVDEDRIGGEEGSPTVAPSAPIDEPKKTQSLGSLAMEAEKTTSSAAQPVSKGNSATVVVAIDDDGQGDNYETTPTAEVVNNHKCQRIPLATVASVTINDEENKRQAATTARKQSQCSSRRISSTSFMSCGSSQQSTSTAPATNPVVVGGGCGGGTSTTTTNGNGVKLNKTISRSMLELDQSNRADQFEVVWTDLSFSYTPNCITGYTKKPTHVLRSISGRFKSNQLVAVIGPSGCGKTTLLQFLAGNNPCHGDKLRIVGLDEPKVAFIGQGDCLLPGLTARETLIYASRLQNSRANFDHQRHIQPIISALGLADCSDRSVMKLSGGQAKRVTIAQELLYPTNLLILDEVTSGLDASTSYSIVKLLKQLVMDNDYPMSIVISIHQPSARLFSVFDQVYVMSEGCCLYEGSCRVVAVNEHLKRFGLECPKFHNIADYLIEIASDDLSSDKRTIKDQMIEFQRKQSLVQGDDSTRQIYERRAQEASDNSNSRFFDNDNDDDDDDKDQKSSAAQQVSMLMNAGLYTAIERGRSKRERPMFEHLVIHFSRSLVRIRRSYILTYLQLVTYILLGLQLSTFYGPSIGQVSGCPRLPLSFITIVFSNETMDNLNLEMRRVQENMNFLLVAIMTATFAALEITVITFPLEAKTVKREWRNGWYRVSSYFLGRTLADLPFQLVFVVAFCVVVYTLTGQIGLTTWRFASFVIIIIMTAMIAQTVGFIFGALFMDNLPAAVFSAPLCIFPALLFSGFFSRVSQIPPFYKPMTYLSHFRYAFDALLVTLYGYDRCHCDQVLLDSYHASEHNQTNSIRDMFRSLFGSVDCGTTTTMSPNADENSIEDMAITSASQEQPPLSHLTSLLNHTATTMLPNKFATSVAQGFTKTLEDALVDSVFEHINRTAGGNHTEAVTTTADNMGGGGTTAMDHLVDRFSHRVTSMLNSQANFGNQVPLRCQDFNPYLMSEFDLHNEDLMFGLMMMFIFVLLSRLMCNAILTVTIATRTT